MRSIHCTASHPKMDHGDVLRSGKRCFSKSICSVCAQHAQTTKTHESKRKEILLSIARHLVTPFVTQRHKFRRLSRKIKEAIILCGFATDYHESTVQNTEGEDYRAMAGKRGRCHLCDKRKDVKTQFVCKLCAMYACKDHMIMTIICNACKVQDAKGEESE